jgi:magnesium chelatase subunit D
VSGSPAALAAWADALRAAALLAADPLGLGGALITAGHGPARERWLAVLRQALPASAPMRKLPLHAGDDRLLGGLDLAATLASGRPVAQPGLLAETDGGVLVVAMAERLSDGTAARLCAALDTGEVHLERDGLRDRRPARLAVVALDEHTGDEPPPPARLLERLAFRLDLRSVGLAELAALPGLTELGDPAAAGPRGGAGGVAGAGAAAAPDAPAAEASDASLSALSATALALGVGSPRAELLALRAARAAAALAGRVALEAEDLELAARLVLAPRATRLPAPAEPDPAPDDTEASDDTAAPPPDPDARPEPAPPPADPPPADARADDAPETPPPTVPEDGLPERILDAARAAVPAGLLATLALERAQAGRGHAGGRAGAQRENRLRGRPTGARPGLPRDGARLAVVDTLRAAAPWQRLRQPPAGAPATAASAVSAAAAAGGAATPPTAGQRRVAVRASDFRVARLQQRTETTTIFAVDASGSSALHRLAEAKGAVELLLADCYVRRDRVAVVAFRGRGAEVLLEPTRSLVRARRQLAGLPGGGGTPLAAGLEAAATLAGAVRRRGGTPVLVVLTDGRANVARDGAGGRERAATDARAAARRLRADGQVSLLIDTSPQPQITARELAAEMGAAYLPLPRADAASVSGAVQAIAARGARQG